MELFEERLDFVLDGRKKHPWGKALGISQGVISSMFEGVVPHAEVLTAICRAENVSLTWLLEGRGDPFIIAKPQDTEQALSFIETLLNDETWTAYVVTDGKECTIVLTRPGQLTTKQGKIIDYTISEVVAGACGPESIALIYISNCNKPIYKVSVDSDTSHKLRSGHMGMYQIYNNEADHILNQDNPLTSLNDVLESSTKEPDPYLIANISRLSQDHKKIAQDMIKNLLKIEGKDWATHGDDSKQTHD